jgi:hypothetical protein
MITRKGSHRNFHIFFCAAACHLAIATTLIFFILPATAQEWLTPAELQKLRDEQDVVKRTQLYMAAAKLRLETAEARLAGKSSKAGDPLEFHTQADLVGGCRSALRGAMLNIQDQITYKKLRGPELTKSLKTLKSSAESILPRLREILKTARDRLDEPLYRVTKDCIEFAESAVRGADQGLEKYKSEPAPEKKPY